MVLAGKSLTMQPKSLRHGELDICVSVCMSSQPNRPCCALQALKSIQQRTKALNFLAIKTIDRNTADVDYLALPGVEHALEQSPLLKSSNLYALQLPDLRCLQVSQAGALTDQAGTYILCSTFSLTQMV